MKFRIAIPLLLVLSFLSCSGRNEQIDSILQELDRTIDNRWRYEQEKLQKIDRLKEELAKTDEPLVRMEYYSALFDQYKNYQYDSAFVYAKLLEQSAVGEYKAKAQIALLHCFKSVGFFYEAVEVIKAFNPEGIPPSLCAEFYFLCAETWQSLSSYVSGSDVLSAEYDAQRLACYNKVLEYAE